MNFKLFINPILNNLEVILHFKNIKNIFGVQFLGKTMGGRRSWRAGADCKSVGKRLWGFESLAAHKIDSLYAKIEILV